jgi:hypothetical protein
MYAETIQARQPRVNLNEPSKEPRRKYAEAQELRRASLRLFRRAMADPANHPQRLLTQSGKPWSTRHVTKPWAERYLNTVNDYYLAGRSKSDAGKKWTPYLLAKLYRYANDLAWNAPVTKAQKNRAGQHLAFLDALGIIIYRPATGNPLATPARLEYSAAVFAEAGINPLQSVSGGMPLLPQNETETDQNWHALNKKKALQEEIVEPFFFEKETNENQSQSQSQARYVDPWEKEKLTGTGGVALPPLHRLTMTEINEILLKDGATVEQREAFLTKYFGKAFLEKAGQEVKKAAQGDKVAGHLTGNAERHKELRKATEATGKVCAEAVEAGVTNAFGIVVKHVLETNDLTRATDPAALLAHVLRRDLKRHTELLEARKRRLVVSPAKTAGELVTENGRDYVLPAETQAVEASVAPLDGFTEAAVAPNTQNAVGDVLEGLEAATAVTELLPAYQVEPPLQGRLVAHAVGQAKHLGGVSAADAERLHAVYLARRSDRTLWAETDLAVLEKELGRPLGLAELAMYGLRLTVNRDAWQQAEQGDSQPVNVLHAVTV